MARNRKRAKQRKAKRDASSTPGKSEGVVRGDLPGALGHSSGDVDEFDAKLVAGAGGTPAEPKLDPSAGGAVDPEALSDAEFAELEDRIDDVEEKIESGDQEAITEAEDELEVDIETRQAELAATSADGATVEPRKKSIFGRFLDFLRASWAELQRVQWPDRRQVGQATAVVIGFVVIAGAYLGLADVAAQKLVNLII